MFGRNAFFSSPDTIKFDFESIPDFSLTLAPWQNVDLDHHITYSIQGHKFPNDTVAKAFMCFNPAAVSPPMTDSAIKPHSGAKFGACISAIPAPNNDWLISPKIHLGQSGQFLFWVKSYTDAYGLEEYNVLISVTDSAPSSFTVISGSQPLRAPTTWTRKMFDLSGYNNRDVYLAIQCVSNDHFILMVDDIGIIPTSSAYPSSASLDFENLANFTLDLFPWTTADVKGGATWIIYNISFLHSGDPMAYICFNPAATTPPEQYMKPHSGQRLGCCFSSMPPNNPNDKWLISPRLTLGTSSALDLWVETYNTAYGYEKYNIAVSTTDNDPSSFVNLTATPDSAPADWTHRTYDLQAYNNKTVYVAIQCVSDNQFIFMLDDIHITSLAGIRDYPESIRISVYPNPAHDCINFYCDLPAGTLIKADLVNILGRSQRSVEFENGTGAVKMDIHDLGPGIYSLVIHANGRQAVQKILIQ